MPKLELEKHMPGRVLLLLLVFSGLAGCEKARLDEEVRRLCAKDGGIKVYETVMLSHEKFNALRMINFYMPDKGEDSIGEDYILKSGTYFYIKGNPEMWRRHYQVLRRNDKKILGEAIRYTRTGGDFPGPWHKSSFACPETTGIETLLMKIFIPTEK
jgi:hypothetical protein